MKSCMRHDLVGLRYLICCIAIALILIPHAHAESICSTTAENSEELYDVYLGVASSRGTYVQSNRYGVGLTEHAIAILDYPSDMKMARLCDGNLVAVWLAETYGRTAENLTARIYSSDFQPLVEEFQISKAKSQWEHSIASLHGSGFVVTWKSWGLNGKDDIRIFARIFNASGKPITKPIRVSLTDGNNHRATAYGLPGGGFAVVWLLSGGAYLRIFDEKGVSKTGEVFVAYTNQLYFSAPSDATSYGYVTQDGKINLFFPDDSSYVEKQPIALARSFDLNGNPLTESIEANATTAIEGHKWEIVKIKNVEGHQLETERFLRAQAKRIEHSLRGFRQKDVMGFQFCQPPSSYWSAAWANKLQKYSTDNQVKDFAAQFWKAYSTECP